MSLPAVSAIAASRPSRARAAVLLLAAATAAVAVACKGNPSGVSGMSFAGSYRLEAVDGRNLPHLFNCFQGVCQELLSARLETMSRGRVRDIMQIRPGPQAAVVWDTLVSSYVVEGRMVIVTRAPLDGSQTPYKDTADVDASGRLLLRAHRIRLDANNTTFLYAKE